MYHPGIGVAGLKKLEGNLRLVIASVESLPGTYRSTAAGSCEIGYERKR
jgi:hypothetical protein